MARAKPTGSGPAEKRPSTRKPAAKAAAVDQQETGASAPVSTPGQSAASEKPAVPPAPATSGHASGSPVEGAPDAIERVSNFAPIGRFPEGWKYEPSASDGAQTAIQEGHGQAVESSLWGMPDITEFPCELTLTNNTRHLVVVRPLSVRVGRFDELKVTCPTAEQYAAIRREFSGRAVRERWGTETGLKVTIHVDD